MIRVKDLKNQIDVDGPHPSLVCPACYQEYSANAGDYFTDDPNRTFRHCRRNMILAVRRTVFEEVRNQSGSTATDFLLVTLAALSILALVFSLGALPALIMFGQLATMLGGAL